MKSLPKDWLGLKSSYKKVRSGDEGLVDEHRDYRYNGIRHERQVRVRPGYPRNPGRWGWGLGYAQDSEVLVRCAAPEFSAVGKGRRLELTAGPPEIDRLFAELDGAHRWKRTTVDSDGQRIRVHREMRMIGPTNIHDWAHDLWLAEQLADRLGKS